MTSHEGGGHRDLRPAEAAGSTETDTERVERLYGCNTPMPESFNPGEWEPYSMRKPNSGTQSVWGVPRNDRTPLNTPYTPTVVKLQLKRHDGNDAGEHGSQNQARELVATIRASVVHLVQPFRYMRSIVDRVIGRLLPRSIVHAAGFQRHRAWIVWYLTTVLCIPFVLLLSPMVIAFCICTSPVWIAGSVVLLIRACIPSGKHAAPVLTEEYVQSPSPHHRVNGTRGVNGASHVHHHHHHHHSSPVSRRTNLLPNDVADG